MSTNQTVRALLFTLIMSFFAIGTIAIAKEVMKKETATSEQSGLHWYFKEANGSYRYLGQSVAPPTSESCTPPDTEEEEICMKGLTTNPAANDVNDSTPAQEVIPRKPLAN